MADAISEITKHTEFRFLDELDTKPREIVTDKKTGQTLYGEKGIRTHHNLGFLDRIFGWLRGQTVEIKVGNKEYILSKRSLEDFLVRNGAVTQQELDSSKNRYTFVVEKLQVFLEANKGKIAQEAQKLPKDPKGNTEILKKDMYTTLIGKDIKLVVSARKDLTVDFKKVVFELKKEDPEAASTLTGGTIAILPVVDPKNPTALPSAAAALAKAVLSAHKPKHAIDAPQPTVTRREADFEGTTTLRQLTPKQKEALFDDVEAERQVFETGRQVFKEAAAAAGRREKKAAEPPRGVPAWAVKQEKEKFAKRDALDKEYEAKRARFEEQQRRGAKEAVAEEAALEAKARAKHMSDAEHRTDVKRIHEPTTRVAREAAKKAQLGVGQPGGLRRGPHIEIAKEAAAIGKGMVEIQEARKKSIEARAPIVKQAAAAAEARGLKPVQLRKPMSPIAKEAAAKAQGRIKEQEAQKKFIGETAPIARTAAAEGRDKARARQEAEDWRFSPELAEAEFVRTGAAPQASQWQQVQDERAIAALCERQPTWIKNDGSYKATNMRKTIATQNTNLKAALGKQTLGNDKDLYFFVAKKFETLAQNRKGTDPTQLAILKNKLQQLPKFEKLVLAEIARKFNWVTDEAKAYFRQLAA